MLGYIPSAPTLSPKARTPPDEEETLTTTPVEAQEHNLLLLLPPSARLLHGSHPRSNSTGRLWPLGVEWERVEPVGGGIGRMLPHWLNMKTVFFPARQPLELPRRLGSTGASDATYTIAVAV